MAAQLFTLPQQVRVSSSGAPYALAKAYWYRANTTTAQDVYTTSALSVAHAQPVQADSAGQFPAIWMDPATNYDYRVIIKTSADVTLDDYTIPRGPVSAATFSSEVFTATAGQTVFTISASYTPGSATCSVYLNGAKLITGPDYTETSSTVITLVVGAADGDNVEIITGSQVTANGSSSALVTFLQSGTGAVARTVQSKERDTVSVKDYGAVGDGVTDDTAAIQAAVNYWVANPVDLLFPSNSTFYVTTAIVATFSSNCVLQKCITGYGSRLTTAAGVVNALTVTVSGASTVVRNLMIEGLEIAHAGTGYGLVMQGPLAATSYLYGCTVRDLVITGASGMSLLGNFFESEISNCRIEAGTTGYGIYISTAGGSGAGSGGIVSSLALLQNTVRGGVNCVYGNSDISDVYIWGGTYLSSQNEGINLTIAQGGLIYGAHVEDVWKSASGFVAGNSAIRVAIASAYTIKDCTFAVGTGKANECIRAYVSGNGTAHLNPGYVYGISTNYYLQGAASSYAILYGEATYTTLGGVAITHIKGLRTLAPVSSKNTATLISPSTVTPSSDYGVYYCAITTNPTIAAPTFTPAYGDELEFMFQQAGGGGNTVTWNAVYSVGSFVPTSTFGKISSIRLRYVNVYAGSPTWVVTSIGTT